MESKHKGQSLVEMALLIPILIFLLIGIFEVGYVIRNYMIILNASREGARFAARPNYLKDTEEVFEHTKISMSNQIEFENKGDVVLSVIESDSDLLCDPATLNDENGKRKFKEFYHQNGELWYTDWWPDCDCESDPYLPYGGTITTTSYISLTSQINLNELMVKISEGNRRHNCLSMKKTPLILPSINKSVLVEVFYEHNQILGFPFISNPFTDPITLHAYTIMRVTEIRNRNWE